MISSYRHAVIATALSTVVWPGASNSTIALQQSAAESRKEVKISYVSYSPIVPRTWDELIARADLVCEVDIRASAPGEAPYLVPNSREVVTAYTARVVRILHAGSEFDSLAKQILILTPGGTVDRGAYIEEVRVNSQPPLEIGKKYLVGLVWSERLQAWTSVAHQEAIFEVLESGVLRSSGRGPLAKQAQAEGLSKVVERVRAAASHSSKP